MLANSILHAPSLALWWIALIETRRIHYGPGLRYGRFSCLPFDHVKNKYVKSVADHQTLQNRSTVSRKNSFRTCWRPPICATRHRSTGTNSSRQHPEQTVSSWDEQLDVIVTNPPFGGTKKTVLRRTFRQRCKPAKRRIVPATDCGSTGEKRSRGGGIADGTLFGEGVKTKIKKLLTESATCILSCVYRMGCLTPIPA